MRKVAFLFSTLFLVFIAIEATDPLPSWNEGTAKKRILEFVEEVTNSNHIHFIPTQERIAAFDQDGTLWVEQPMYPELFYSFAYINEHAGEHPEWQEIEPYKTVLDGGSLSKLSANDISLIWDAAHSGMTVKKLHEEVRNWINKALHPRFNRHFAALVYQPMLEVMQFLRNHKFTIYIVSGNEQEFLRAFSQKLYGVPPQCIIGSAGKLKYSYEGRNPVLIKLPELLFTDDKQGKPESIQLIAGRIPVIAFGNSVGDQQMLEWTQSNERPSLELLVHHDDAEREYAYGPRSKIGTFPDALMDEAHQRKWIVISMKNDWKVIFQD